MAGAHDAPLDLVGRRVVPAKGREGGREGGREERVR